MLSIHNVGLHVAESLKQNISRGKYINISKVLQPTGGLLGAMEAD